MANLEDLEEEVRELRVKNSELVLEVQTLRMTAAQRDREKLDLMKTINDLRLKLTRLRSRGVVEARKLVTDLQSASEETISHLVQASAAAVRSIELAKQYMQSTQELASTQSPRWSNLSGTSSPSTHSKVNKVPPQWVGGQSIQPVVSLSRAVLNSSTRLRSPTQNMNGAERAVPMRMLQLQDVYIPLTRLNLPEMQASEESDVDSTEELGLQENGEQMSEETENNTTEDINETRRLYDVAEEPEEEDNTSKCNPARLENPLEGPSWLLDRPRTDDQRSSRPNLEPDSTTTPCEEQQDDAEKENEPRKSVTLVFTPTVRRPKRASPAPAPLSPIRNSNRVLKVVLAKMHPNELQGVAKRRPSDSQGGSPPKIAKVYSSTPTRDAPRRTATVEDSLLGSSRLLAVSPCRSNEASQREFNRSRSPAPGGAAEAGGAVLKTSCRKNVTQRKHTPSYVSHSSDDDSNVGDHDVEQRHNVTERHRSSACNIRQGAQHFSDFHDRNVSKRHNLNERHSRENNDDTIEIDEGDDDVRNVNKCRDTQRDTRNKNYCSDRYDGNISEIPSGSVKNSERDSFRGFVSERAGRTDCHVVHYERERNVNDSSNRNESDSHDKNYNSSRVKNRDKKVSSGRDRDANESCGENVSDSHNENVLENRDRNVNVTERNASERHERNVAQRNSNGTRNKKKITKSSRHMDSDDSERSASRQSNEVESDSSSDFEWSRGRARGPARRSRKKVTYTEMPLNRKLRR